MTQYDLVANGDGCPFRVFHWDIIREEHGLCNIGKNAGKKCETGHIRPECEICDGGITITIHSGHEPYVDHNIKQRPKLGGRWEDGEERW